jgi:hypothetical protein
MWYRFLILALLSHYIPLGASQEPAIIIVPVADMLMESYQTSAPRKSVIEHYKNGLVLCPQDISAPGQRVYQALFNEPITIINKKGPEVECEVPYTFYRESTGTRNNRFWTLEKNIKRLSELAKPLGLQSIPPSLTDKLISTHKSVLGLVLPWTDSATGKSYSVGTRFTRAPDHDTPTSYAIALYDYDHNKVTTSFVDKNRALIATPSHHNERKQLFVCILKQWSSMKDGFFPYVWGGCSGLQVCSDDSLCHIETGKTAETVTAWSRSTLTAPYYGFDCSGLILRAAQLAGIPYFFRNTSTLAHYLHPLQVSEKLEKGDLIWFKGHVMIISDVQENKLIEAAGYPSGHGKVHELPISKVFSGVKSYKELLTLYHAKKPLARLTSTGTAYQEIPSFLILKLDNL